VLSDKIIGETITECTLSFVTYNYTQVSSRSNIFTVGKKEKIPLDPGYGLMDPSSSRIESGIFFIQSGLPDSHVNFPDLAVLGAFSTSPEIVGTMYEGES